MERNQFITWTALAFLLGFIIGHFHGAPLLIGILGGLMGLIAAEARRRESVIYAR